jgi:peptide/nickel transport system permease protein
VNRYVIRKALRAALTIWFTVTVVFVATRATGDPTEWLLPDDATLSERRQLRSYLGIDKPLPVQYTRYLRNVLKGDMGQSYYHNQAVSRVYAERLLPTLRLGVSAFVLSVSFGLPLGMLAALYRNSALDRITMSVSIAGYTIPNFVLGILLIFLFSLVLRVLPSGGYGGPAHYVMPVFALSVGPMASIARLTRSSMLDVLRQDYMLTARAKGVPEWLVVAKHGLRNGFIPVITIIGLQVGGLIGGSVVVETVFAWPGMGQLIVSAAQTRDYPLLQFGVLLVTGTIVTANMLVDVAYAALDPRIRRT